MALRVLHARRAIFCQRRSRCYVKSSTASHRHLGHIRIAGSRSATVRDLGHLDHGWLHWLIDDLGM